LAALSGGFFLLLSQNSAFSRRASQENVQKTHKPLPDVSDWCSLVILYSDAIPRFFWTKNDWDEKGGSVSSASLRTPRIPGPQSGKFTTTVSFFGRA
jgi:hypothetical protein